jgi:hypothetical protein
MTTVSKKFAQQMASNNGIGDPQVYAIIKHKNSFFNYKTDYAVCFSQADFLYYVDCHEITEILFTSDEVLRESFKNGNN